MARPLNSALELFGAKVAAELEQGSAERGQAIDAARKRFLARGAPQRASRQRSTRGLVAAASALAVAASGGLFLSTRPPRPLEFSVDGASGVAATWLAAPRVRPLLVPFSDGTRLRIEPSARARVIDIDGQGARIALESGAIQADVARTPRGSWRLIAGPFTIRVTGTRFDLRWDSASEKLSITVYTGSVAVAGSIVGIERSVRAGQTLVVSIPEGRSIVSDNAAPSSSAAEPLASQAPRLDDNGAVSPGEVVSPDAPAPVGTTSTVPDPAASAAASGAWRKLAKNGDLRRAFALAEASGFQSACDAASSSELLVLGDAARLSGRSDRAVEALLALRRRFPHDPRRGAAAFALGKVAFDRRRDYRHAAEWFSTCLREQPAGPLAREASGRLLEALRNAGNVAGAAQAARDYLSRYPDGPHADAARALLK